MDEKMKKLIEGIYESLTDEQKEKAKACKTMDELMAFMDQEGLELPDEMLDAVAGGFNPFIGPGATHVDLRYDDQPQSTPTRCPTFDPYPDPPFCVLG